MKNKEIINNKIIADTWFIVCTSHNKEKPFLAKIDYMLGDETNTKSHRFATYQEAYQWLENQVQL